MGPSRLTALKSAPAEMFLLRRIVQNVRIHVRTQWCKIIAISSPPQTVACSRLQLNSAVHVLLRIAQKPN